MEEGREAWKAAGNGVIQGTHHVNLELLSNATTIINTLNHIRGKQEGYKKKKHLSLESTNNYDDSNGDSQ